MSLTSVLRSDLPLTKIMCRKWLCSGIITKPCILSIIIQVIMILSIRCPIFIPVLYMMELFLRNVPELLRITDIFADC